MSARKLETGIRTISAGIPYTFTHYSCGLRLLGFQLLRFYCNRFWGLVGFLGRTFYAGFWSVGGHDGK